MAAKKTKKFGGRKYTKKKTTSYAKKKKKEDTDDEDEYEERTSRRRSSGKGRRGKKSYGKNDDAEFIHITGLFESRNGNSFTVFLKEEHLEKLQELGEDDLLGVTESQYGMSLWVKKAED